MIQGLRDTSGFTTAQRPYNWRETVMLLKPNGDTPLTALTSMMKSEAVDDPRYYHFEKTMNSRRAKLGATITAGATNWTLTTSGGVSALGLVDGTLLYGEHSGEIVMVIGDPSSATSITVQRGFAGTSAAAVDNITTKSPYWRVIGNAHEEGSMPPSGVNFDPNEYYNYLQIFRNTLESTRTAMKTRLRTGDAIKEAKRECLEMHANDMEMAFWLGSRNSTVRNGKPLRTAGGFKWYMDTYASNNVIDASGSWDMDTLEENLLEIFRYGSNEKFGMIGSRALLAIQRIARKNTTWNITSGVKEIGMNVTRLDSPYGSLVLKSHSLWNQMQGDNANYYGMDTWLAVLDMENVHYRYLKGDDTRYEKDLQPNGMDGSQSGYLSECGLELYLPSTHYLVTNLADGVADT